MSSISKHQQVLKNIFVTKKLNKAGIYAVRLFIRGKPWLMTVDDNFLFMTWPERLRYNQFDLITSSLWASILEKAVAKLKGNYDHL